MQAEEPQDMVDIARPYANPLADLDGKLKFRMQRPSGRTESPVQIAVGHYLLHLVTISHCTNPS